MILVNFLKHPAFRRNFPKKWPSLQVFFKDFVYFLGTPILTFCGTAINVSFWSVNNSNINNHLLQISKSNQFRLFFCLNKVTNNLREKQEITHQNDPKKAFL